MIVCEKCGKKWDDGLDKFLTIIGIDKLESDTNLCPDCLQDKNDEVVKKMESQ